MQVESAKLAVLCALAIFASSVGGHELLDKEYIVGGVKAGIGEFPSAVSIRRLNNDHFCGGAMISKRHVLTAAHCVYPYASNVTAMNLTGVVGTNSLLNGGQYLTIVNAWYHSEYVPGQKSDIAYDIGMYIFAKDAVLSHLVQPAKLPRRNPQDGDSAVVIGWGVFQPPMVLAGNLQKLNVKIMNYTECGRIAPTAIQVTESHVCTLVVRGMGTCVGDSGSPVMSGDTVIGVVSGGIPCALGYPDVLTNVFYQLEEVKTRLATDGITLVGTHSGDGQGIDGSILPDNNKKRDDNDYSLFSGNKDINITIQNVNITFMPRAPRHLESKLSLRMRSRSEHVCVRATELCLRQVASVAALADFCLLPQYICDVPELQRFYSTGVPAFVRLQYGLSDP